MPYMDTIRAVHDNLNVPDICTQYILFTRLPRGTNLEMFLNQRLF